MSDDTVGTLRMKIIADDSSLATSVRASAQKAGHAVEEEAGRTSQRVSTMLRSINTATSGALGPLTEVAAVFRESGEASEVFGGRASASLAKVGLAAIGVGGIITALGSKDTQAQNALSAAIDATGSSMENYEDKIKVVEASAEKLAFSHEQVNGALATLTEKTGSAATALQNMELTENLARAAHISLAAAANQVGRAHESGGKLFKSYGVNVTDAEKATHNYQASLDELNRKLSGQAAAAVTGFGGKLAILKTQIEDGAAALGQKYGPAVTAIGAATTTLTTIFGAFQNRQAAGAAKAAEAAVANEVEAASLNKVGGAATRAAAQLELYTLAEGAAAKGGEAAAGANLAEGITKGAAGLSRASGLLSKAGGAIRAGAAAIGPEGVVIAGGLLAAGLLVKGFFDAANASSKEGKKNADDFWAALEGKNLPQATAVSQGEQRIKDIETRLEAAKQKLLDAQSARDDPHAFDKSLDPAFDAGRLDANILKAGEAYKTVQAEAHEAEKGQEGLVQSYKDAAVAANESVDPITKQADKLLASVDPANKLAVAIVGVTNAKAKLAADKVTFGSDSDAVYKDIAALKTAQQAVKALGADYGQTAGAASNHAFADSIATINDLSSTEAQRFDAVRSALASLDSEQSNAIKSNGDYYASLDTVTKSLKDNGHNFDQTTEKGRANVSALLALADATKTKAANDVQADVALGHYGKAQKDANADITAGRKAIMDALDPLHKNTKAAGEYADKLGLIPKKAVTALDVTIQNQHLTDIEGKFKHLSRDRVAKIAADADKGDLKGAAALLNGISSDKVRTAVINALAITDAAKAELNSLTAPRRVAITPYVTGYVDPLAGTGIGNALHRAGGGDILGPGTGTSDSIPAMLSNGEFVVNAKAAKKFGPLLRRINSNMEEHFAAGGTVDRLAQTVQNFASGGTANTSPTYSTGYDTTALDKAAKNTEKSADSTHKAAAHVAESAKKLADAAKTAAEAAQKRIVDRDDYANDKALASINPNNKLALAKAAVADATRRLTNETKAGTDARLKDIITLHQAQQALKDEIKAEHDAAVQKAKDKLVAKDDLLRDKAIEKANGNATKIAAADLADLTRRVKETKKGTDEYYRALTALHDLQRAQAAAKNEGIQLTHLADVYGVAKKEVTEFASAQGVTLDGTAKSTKAFNAAVTAYKRAGTTLGELSHDYAVLHDKLSSATDTANAFSDAMNKIKDASGESFLSAMDQAQEAINNLANGLDTANGSLTGSDNASIGNRSSITAALDKARDAAAADFAAGDTLKGAEALYRQDYDAVRNSLIAAGLKPGDIDNFLTNTLHLSPDQVSAFLDTKSSTSTKNPYGTTAGAPGVTNGPIIGVVNVSDNSDFAIMISQLEAATRRGSI